MGLLNLLMVGKQSNEMTSALVGAYVYSKLSDDAQKETIMIHTYRLIYENLPTRQSFGYAQEMFNTSPGIVQAALMANAMIDLGINHGIRGLQWNYIPNPFRLPTYSKRALRAAVLILRDYGINPGESFIAQTAGSG
jgi:hypothetical protein